MIKHFWRRKWQPTPVFLPGKSYGQTSLVGYSPWGHKESDTTERLNHHHHPHHALITCQALFCFTCSNAFHPHYKSVSDSWHHPCFTEEETEALRGQEAGRPAGVSVSRAGQLSRGPHCHGDRLRSPSDCFFPLTPLYFFPGLSRFQNICFFGDCPRQPFTVYKPRPSQFIKPTDVSDLIRSLEVRLLYSCGASLLAQG